MFNAYRLAATRRDGSRVYWSARHYASLGDLAAPGASKVGTWTPHWHLATSYTPAAAEAALAALREAGEISWTLSQVGPERNVSPPAAIG